MNVKGWRSKRGPKDATFQALQQKWDRRLKRDGFVDIECGTDLAATDGSTFRGGDSGHGGVALHADVSDLSGSLYDSTRYAYWAAATHAANALSDGDKHKPMLLRITECGGVNTAAKEFGVHRRTLRRLWKAFLLESGIGRNGKN